jgi:hypothetical protein
VIVLKNDNTANDPRLGRIPQPDPRNANYPSRALIRRALPITRRTWRLDVRLDQGQTPTCVGHAWTHDHAAAPGTHKVDEGFALNWYRLAQLNDEWPGVDYDGSSTIGGAKAGVKQGFFQQYVWCFSPQDVADTVLSLGPVVMGTEWLTAMFDPDLDGLVKVAGRVEGGHEWLVRGVDTKKELFQASNSWSRDWGVNGDFFIHFDDLGLLLEADGDACHPVRS